ncbi:hypothetical protein B296_00051479 [Ensete ventricosum]|uniref:POX domain-containing protein n=1 Tax=Ensete ventricosum TaxID=4639 RepID=A0A426YGN0_ENSVE|nr:hypothetical protein B296_00051479 [Ensete ventricosum]
MSNNQSDTTPDLCLRDQEHPPYSVPANMMYLGFSNSGAYADALGGSTQTQQNHNELPVATTLISQGLTTGNSDILNSHPGDHAYNAWKDGRNEMLFMQTLDGSINVMEDQQHADDPRMNLQSQLGIISRQSLSLQQSSVSAMQNQGLSLSLSTQMPVPSIQYQPSSSDISFIGSHQSTSGNLRPFREESFQNKSVHGNISPYGLSTLASSISNSRYLRVAQELLDEVINVRKALRQKAEKNQCLYTSAGSMTCKNATEGSNVEGMTPNPQDASANSSSELSPSERQDLQNKSIAVYQALLGTVQTEVYRRYPRAYNDMPKINVCNTIPYHSLQAIWVAHISPIVDQYKWYIDTH